MKYSLGVFEDSDEEFDFGHQFVVFILEFFPLEVGQFFQLHFKDGKRLKFGETKLAHQVCLGGIGTLALFDGFDDLVDNVKGFQKTFENMGAGFGVFEFELTASDDDVLPVMGVFGEYLFEVKEMGGAIAREGDHIGWKTALEFGVLVEIVQDTLRFGVALEFDGDGHALAVGFVTKIGNTVEFFLLDQVGNMGDEPGFVDLIWKFGNGNLIAAIFLLDDFGYSPIDDIGLTGEVEFFDFILVKNLASGWEIGALDMGDQFLDFNVGLQVANQFLAVD